MQAAFLTSSLDLCILAWCLLQTIVDTTNSMAILVILARSACNSMAEHNILDNSHRTWHDRGRLECLSMPKTISGHSLGQARDSSSSLIHWIWIHISTLLVPQFITLLYYFAWTVKNFCWVVEKCLRMPRWLYAMTVWLQGLVLYKPMTTTLQFLWVLKDICSLYSPQVTYTPSHSTGVHKDACAGRISR